MSQTTEEQGLLYNSRSIQHLTARRRVLKSKQNILLLPYSNKPDTTFKILGNKKWQAQKMQEPELVDLWLGLSNSDWLIFAWLHTCIDIWSNLSVLDIRRNQTEILASGFQVVIPVVLSSKHSEIGPLRRGSEIQNSNSTNGLDQWHSTFWLYGPDEWHRTSLQDASGPALPLPGPTCGIGPCAPGLGYGVAHQLCLAPCAEIGPWGPGPLLCTRSGSTLPCIPNPRYRVTAHGELHGLNDSARNQIWLESLGLNTPDLDKFSYSGCTHQGVLDARQTESRQVYLMSGAPAPQLDSLPTKWECFPLLADAKHACGTVQSH